MAKLRKFDWSDNWYIVWSDGRSRKLSTKTPDKAVAETILKRWEAEQNAPPEEPAVNSIVEGYLKELEDRRWYDNREYEMRAVRKHFGQLPPNLISVTTVRGFISKRRREGVAGSTIDRQLRALRACLSWGVKNGWIEKAPYIESPGGNPPKDRWLTRDETNALVAACGSPHIDLFVRTALHTGARTSSVLGLTWDRVDLRRGVVLYPPTEPGSRKRTAIVPINQSLLGHLERARGGALCDNVIEFRGKPVQSIKTGFRAAVRRSGIAHCTPHDLRRTCATWMVQSGIPLEKVARYLGDTKEMIEKVYGHHSPDYLRDAARALEG